MSTTLVFICDRCGCAEHVDVTDPSCMPFQYVPNGWMARNSGHNTPYKWYCEVCAKAVSREEKIFGRGDNQ